MTEPVAAEKVMRNILIRRGPGFAAFLLFLPAFIFVASLFWRIAQAAAVQTSYYQGPAFDIPYCQSQVGPGLCVGGSITGSVTTSGTSVVNWEFDAGAIGHLSHPVFNEFFYALHFTD